MHKAWHRTSALKFGHLKLDNCVQAPTHKILPTSLLNSTNDTLVRVIETGLVCQINNHIRRER